MSRTRPTAFLLLIVFAACGGRHEHVAHANPPEPHTTQTGSPAASAPPPQAAAATGPIDVGAAMPAYATNYLDGSKLDLAGMRGKPVFLNLWATWCGPCRYEIPEVQAMHDRFAPQGLQVVGVSLDEGGNDLVKGFVASHKMTYPIALDPDGRLASMLDASVIPTSVLIDRNGKVIWKKYGIISMSDTTLSSALAKALAKG